MATKNNNKFLALARNLRRLLSQAITMDERVLGVSPENSNWEHHLAGMMIVACMSSLEKELGLQAWTTYRYRTGEFQVISCIRNAYVHQGSDTSKLRAKSCARRVTEFLKALKKERVLGSANEQPVEPYFRMNKNVVELNEKAISRMYSLYVGLLQEAGRIPK